MSDQKEDLPLTLQAFTEPPWQHDGSIRTRLSVIRPVHAPSSRLKPFLPSRSPPKPKWLCHHFAFASVEAASSEWQWCPRSNHPYDCVWPRCDILVEARSRSATEKTASVHPIFHAADPLNAAPAANCSPPPAAHNPLPETAQSSRPARRAGSTRRRSPPASPRPASAR